MNMTTTMKEKENEIFNMQEDYDDIGGSDETSLMSGHSVSLHALFTHFAASELPIIRR